MKPITKEITETKTVGYEANDGTFFKDKEECEKYESTCKGVIMSAFHKLVKGKTDMGTLLNDYNRGDNKVYIVEIGSVNDLETINKALTLYGSPLITNRYMYKDVMIQEDCCFGELWSLGTIDEFINNIKDNYNNALIKEGEAL